MIDKLDRMMHYIIYVTIFLGAAFVGLVVARIWTGTL